MAASPRCLSHDKGNEKIVTIIYDGTSPQELITQSCGGKKCVLQKRKMTADQNSERKKSLLSRMTRKWRRRGTRKQKKGRGETQEAKKLNCRKKRGKGTDKGGQERITIVAKRWKEMKKEPLQLDHGRKPPRSTRKCVIIGTGFGLSPRTLCTCYEAHF